MPSDTMLFHTFLTNNIFYIQCVIEADDKDKAEKVLSDYAASATAAEDGEFGAYGRGCELELMHESDGYYTTEDEDIMFYHDDEASDYEDENGRAYLVKSGHNG